MSPEVKKQLEAAAQCLDVKDDGPVIYAVVFVMEKLTDDEYEPHVKMVGDADLLYRYHVLSSAMVAIHAEMDDAIEALQDILTAPPEPVSSERLS